MNALLPTLLGAVAAPALLGAGVVRWAGLSPRDGWRSFVAWSYLAGQLLMAAVTFAWLTAARGVPGVALPAGAVFVGALAWCAAGRRERADAPLAPAAVGDPVVRAATGVCVLALLERCSLAATTALTWGDESNIWAAKARILFADGGVATFAGAQYCQHADYPMLDPLAQALAFAVSGKALLWESRLPIQGFAVALLLLLSAELERRAGRWLAVALLVAFTTSSFLAQAPTACADVPLAFAALAWLAAWSRWAATGAASHWRLGCLAAAATFATKNEGALLAVAGAVGAVAAWLVAARPRRSLPWGAAAPAWLLAPIAVVAAGRWFNACHGFHNDLTGADAAGRGLVGRLVADVPARLPPVLEHLGGLAVDGATTRWLLAIVLLAPLVARGALRRPAAAVPWFAVAAAIAGYAAIFVSSPADEGGPDGWMRGLQWHLQTAADRTLLHLLPVAALAAAELLRAPAPARA